MLYEDGYTYSLLQLLGLIDKFNAFLQETLKKELKHLPFSCERKAKINFARPF